MRNCLKLVLLALAAGAVCTPVVADEHEGEGKFKATGEVRTRWELLDNTIDFRDAESGSFCSSGVFGFGLEDCDDELDFLPYRVRLGLEAQLAKGVDGYVELQAAGIWGDSGALRGFDDPVFQGKDLDIFDDSETTLYQAFVTLNDIGGSGTNLRIGRQEHTLGNELHMGDRDFYNGTSFDGVRIWWNFDNWDLEGFFYKIRERNVFGNDANVNDDVLASLFPIFGASGANPITGDEDAYFAGLDAKFELTDNGQTIEPYLLYNHDGAQELLSFGHSLFTFGALYEREVNSSEDVDAMAFDWSAEIAIQSGEIFPSGSETDLKGNIFEGSFGYNWSHGNDSRSRVHVGALISSGDDDPGDDEFEFFVPIFPDGHANNRLGDLDLFSGSILDESLIFPPFASDGGGPQASLLSFLALPFSLGAGGMSNITDYNAGYTYIGENGKHRIRGSLHKLAVTEKDQFGFDEDDLGLEIDIVYDLMYSENVSFQFGLAQLAPGDLLDELANSFQGGTSGADDARRVWGQVRLAWNKD